MNPKYLLKVQIELNDDGIPNSAKYLDWFLNNPNPRYALTEIEIINLPKHILALLIRQDTLPILLHPNFPFTFRELLSIPVDGYDAMLNDVVIHALVSGRIETFQQMLDTLDEAEAAAIVITADPFQTDDLADTTLEIPPDVLAIPAPVVIPTTRAKARIINKSESIHVHESHSTTGESLLKLQKYYGAKLTTLDFVQNILEIYSWVHSLPNDESKFDIAKRAVTRLLTSEYYKNYKEINSNQTILQSLLLVWIAIHDAEQRFDNTPAGLDTAYDRLIEKLCDLEYRDRGTDTSAELEKLNATTAADPTCLLATHIRIIDAAYTIHKEVKLSQMTKMEQLNLAFANSINRHVTAYLSNVLSTDLSTLDDLQSLQQELDKIHRVRKQLADGCSGIFEYIRQDINTEILQIFSHKGISPEQRDAYIKSREYLQIKGFSKMFSDIKEFDAYINSGQYFNIENIIKQFIKDSDTKIALLQAVIVGRQPVVTPVIFSAPIATIQMQVVVSKSEANPSIGL